MINISFAAYTKKSQEIINTIASNKTLQDDVNPKPA
jgi:hypothetical protein